MDKGPVLAGVFVFLIIAGMGIHAQTHVHKVKSKYERAKKEIKKLADNNEIKDGDIIFQTSLSAQSKAIQQATGSKYSHCGLVYKEADEYYVYEAVQPVKLTPLAIWIGRGQGEHYVIKRLRSANKVLTPATLAAMKQTAARYNGKKYDLAFEWTDDKIYCSELVWKIYKKSTGLELGQLQKLSEFDLSSELVKKKLKERYGNKVPMDETVISPDAIFNSELLETVVKK